MKNPVACLSTAGALKGEVYRASTNPDTIQAQIRKPGREVRIDQEQAKWRNGSHPKERLDGEDDGTCRPALRLTTSREDAGVRVVCIAW